jgi:hypothetical protein
LSPRLLARSLAHAVSPDGQRRGARLGSNHIVAVFGIFIAVLLKYSPKNTKKVKKIPKKSQNKKKTKKNIPLPILQPTTPERYEAIPCPTEATEGALPELTSLCEEGFTGRECLVNSDFLWFRGISR